MNKSLKTAAFALAFSSATALGLATAGAADVHITFDPGNVAYGYRDGYWTRSHEWHTWERPEYVEIYRKHPGARYYEWRHDRDADMGWHPLR
ncbi:hypothetical protein [Reyranella sp.]|jgi:hypothetical protein|uniref:hypothetical protein n=1 Tax=Reyranella sp. TaxID=1929291 RepID=UPI002F934502